VPQALWFIAGLVAGAACAAVVAALVLRRHVRRIRTAERRARAAERLAEIGGMTGGLAHEIKNPLSTIGLNAQLLAEGIGDLHVDDAERGRLVRRVEALRREVDRLRDILQDFLKFAGTIRIEPVACDVNRLVEELCDFYLPQAQQAGVRLRTELEPSGAPALVDGPHLKQALLNLFINAVQAMAASPAGAPAGGDRPRELIVRTARARDESGPVCHIRVIDTGPGIPPEVMPSLFTPYFTTKAGGSGLGLPTSKRIIEEHGGQLTVSSQAGRGTEFLIVLPGA
jgi:signal transduction histidine kinase